jgi:hypothetical protein
MTRDEAREIDRFARSRNPSPSPIGCAFVVLIAAALWVAAFWIIGQARAWWGAHVG